FRPGRERPLDDDLLFLGERLELLLPLRGEELEGVLHAVLPVGQVLQRAEAETLERIGELTREGVLLFLGEGALRLLLLRRWLLRLRWRLRLRLRLVAGRRGWWRRRLG